MDSSDKYGQKRVQLAEQVALDLRPGGSTAVPLRVVSLFVLALAVAACAPAAPNARTQDGDQAASSKQRSKAIAIAVNEDVSSIWDAVTSGGGSGARELANVVNQHLVAITADGSPTPRLLTELPSLDKGTWTVQADGTMQMTWRLRPNAIWHDGTPFTADDLLFSFAVNKDPEVPNGNQEAVRLIASMKAIDDRTVSVIWSEPYPFADRLEHRELFPLPRHLLERSYYDARDSFLLQAYFSEDFVGLGPYRVTRWERGSHLDLAAFDQFFLGRPKIDTIRVLFVTDNNTMLANLKSHTAQMMLTLGSAPKFDALMSLKQDWEATGYGTLLTDPIAYTFIEPQKRNTASPSDLADPRVRQAMMLGIDREALMQVHFGDQGVLADSWVHPSFPQYPQVQSAATRYQTDIRRAASLLEDAGWQRTSGGTIEKNGQRFELTMRDADGEQDALILAANWKTIGITGTYEPRTAALLRDRQDRATFSGVEITVNPMALLSVSRRLATVGIPTAENKWSGSNRGGYSNPAWDELDRRAYTSLQENDRVDIERELVRVYTTDLPLLPLFFRPDVIPVGGGIAGPVANTGVAHRGFILHTWNIADWDLTPKG
jgi:peptide/nickel transport system substrate-binding protein